MAVHEATFGCFCSHLNELVERVGGAAPGTPLPDSVGSSAPELRRDESMVIQALDLTNDAEFVRLLQAVATISEAHAVANEYMEGMMVWREALLPVEDAPSPISHAVDALFGVTVLRLLLGPTCSDALALKVSDSVEEIASSQLLHAVTRSAGLGIFGATADASGAAVQVRFGQRDVCDATAVDMPANPLSSFHELHFPADSICFDSAVVAEVYARIIGVLSQQKLSSLTARFLPRLDTAVRMTAAKDKAPKLAHEAVEIARALRYARLGVQQLDYSIDFLTKIASLMEQQRIPMELKHELCALFAAVLERIPPDERVNRSDDDKNGVDCSAWDAVVVRLYTKIGEWAAKAKHIVPACRALAALLSALSTQSVGIGPIQQYGPSLIDRLVKNSADKALRSVMLASFRAIVKIRLSLPVRQEAMATLLAHAEDGVKRLVALNFGDLKDKEKKKSKEDTSMTQAQLELLVEMAVLLGARDRGRASHTESAGLEFIIEGLIVPALSLKQKSGQKTEDMHLLFGLRTFVGICREYEAVFFKPSAELVVFTPTAMDPRLQRYARKLGPQLSTLLSHYSYDLDLYKNSAEASAAESSARLTEAEKVSGPAQVTIALVQCIPRAVPLMPYEKMQKCIIALLVGTQKEVRDEAVACLKRFVRLWPPLRATIVEALCDLAAHHSDSGTANDNNRILLAARSLHTMVDVWTQMGNLTRSSGYDDGSVGTFHGIREDWAGGSKDAGGGKDGSALVTNPTLVTLIDSTALYLLCSTHAEIRSCGLDLLHASDKLDEKLRSGLSPQRPLSTAQILEQSATTMIERAAVGTQEEWASDALTQLVALGTLTQLVALGSRPGDSKEQEEQRQTHWCRCLSEICAVVTDMRPGVASNLWHFTARAAKAAEPSVYGEGAVHKWRNYTVAALVSVTRNPPTEPVLKSALASPTQKELIQIVVSVLHSPDQVRRSAAVIVLGQVDSPVVFKDQTLAALNKASMTPMEPPSKDGHKHDTEVMAQQLRTDLMAVHRIIAERMHLSTSGPLSGSLSGSDRLSIRLSMDDGMKLEHMLMFVKNTLEYTATNTKAVLPALWEVRTLRRHFCIVVRHVAESAYRDGAPSLFSADERRKTFNLLSEWCEYLAHGRACKQKQDAEHNANLSVNLSAEQRRGRKQYYNELCAGVKQAAQDAICYLFWGPVMDDDDPTHIFSWTKHVFDDTGDTLWQPVQEALENHLICAPSLLPEYIERCYSEQVLGGKSTRLLYLNAIAAACRRKDHADDTDLAALWVLVLHLSADESATTRRAAVLLSQILVEHSQFHELQTPRFNARPAEELFSAMVTSNLQDTYEAQSNALSARLASQIPEISGRFLLEVFRRIRFPRLKEPNRARNRMMAFLTPWMANFTIVNYRKAASPTVALSPGILGSPGSDVSNLMSTDSKDLETGQVLNCVFNLTQSFGRDHMEGIQMLWRSIVAGLGEDNVVPIVTYCIDKVVDTYENDPDGVFALVAQKVAVYMARSHMAVTVRTLMQEVSLLPDTPSSHISRSNVATILLVDIVYESHIVCLRDHAPLLLHLAVLGMDHEDQYYAQRCASLLHNLLHTMVLKATPVGASAACENAALLVQFLESRETQNTWQTEDLNVPGEGQAPPSELKWAISCTIDSMLPTVPDLRERWSHLALHYPLLDRREESMVRCHQVFRFLQHEVQLPHAKQLLFASHAYCQAGFDGAAFLCEAAATIGYVMQRSDTPSSDRLCILFPQFFWIAVALCQADTPAVYITGLRLLREALRIYARSDIARRSLHAGVSAAKAWSRPFRGVQELVVRGLGAAQTEEHAIKTLKELLLLPASMTAPSDPVAGTDENLPIQLVGCLLPWLCQHLEAANEGAFALDADATATATKLAEFCNRCGLARLSPSLVQYAENGSNPKFTPAVFLKRLSGAFCEAMVVVGIAGSVYGPLLTHLGAAPAGLRARRYAKQVLQVLLAVLNDSTHLLASRQTSAEAEAAALVGPRCALAEDAILPLLVSRVCEFAAVRDLSTVAVQVLSVAATAQAKQPGGSSGRGGKVSTSVLDNLTVGSSPDLSDEDNDGHVKTGRVVQAWRRTGAEDPKQSRWSLNISYLSLLVGDEVVVTNSQRTGGQGWHTGYIRRRSTDTGLPIPLSSRAEGRFPMDCVEFDNKGESNDDADAAGAQQMGTDQDTGQALYAICMTLPGTAPPEDGEHTTQGTCMDHERWLRPPIVIPAVGKGVGGGLQLRAARFAAAGVDAAEAVPSRVRWQPLSPERYVGQLSREGSGLGLHASPLPSTLGGPPQGGAGKNTQMLMPPSDSEDDISSLLDGSSDASSGPPRGHARAGTLSRLSLDLTVDSRFAVASANRTPPRTKS